MEEFIGKRIMVIGSPGSGKSHFSTELSFRTGLPLFHLDRGAHASDTDWRAPDEARRFVSWQERTVKDDAWIFDGNYIGTMNLRLDRAETVFFFNFSRLFCLWGYLRRRLFYLFRPKLAQKDGYTERLRFKYVKYIWNFKSRKLDHTLSAYPHLRVFTFRRQNDIKSFFLHLERQIAIEREHRLLELED